MAGCAGAKECGDSLATFNSPKTREQIERELRGLLGEEKKNRIYLITMANGGKFLLGKRKVAPWEGYAQSAIESGEER